MALTGSDLGAMEISLEPAVATAPTVPTADAGGDPATVYLTRLTSAESRRAMATSLELLAELLVDGHPADRTERARRRRDGTPLAMAVPWHELRYGHTQALRSWLAEHCSPAAANRHLAALRGVLRETWRLGLMGGEDLARAIDLASVPGTSLPAGRYVEDGEVRRLVAACLADQSPGGRRDAAVLAALFVGGLRRAEAVALDVEHYEPASGHLTITGRGDVSAAPPFPPAVAGLWPHGSRFGAWRPAVLPGRQGRPGHHPAPHHPGRLRPPRPASP